MRPPFESIRLLILDLGSRLRREGPIAVLGHTVGRVRAGVRSEERLVVIAKDLGEVKEVRSARPLLVEPLERRHLDALRVLNRRRCFRRADRRFKRYVDSSYHGYVGIRDGQAIGYYWWVDRNSSPLHPDLARLGLDIELGADDIYGCDFFMLEEHRGGGTAGKFLYEVERDLARRGYTTLWGYVASDNRPARWLYSLRGYRTMWTVLRQTVMFRRSSKAIATGRTERTR